MPGCKSPAESATIAALEKVAGCASVAHNRVTSPTFDPAVVNGAANCAPFRYQGEIFRVEKPLIELLNILPVHRLDDFMGTKIAGGFVLLHRANNDVGAVILSAEPRQVDRGWCRIPYNPVSYTHLTLPTNREV